MTEWTVNNKLNAWYQKRYHIKLPKEFETKSEIYFGGSSFSPSALFALAEPGVWFDPSDLTTLFQDPAGTTPVTAPGNTVGLMLDKSKGLALGADTAVNGSFATDTGWTKDAGWTISSGKASTSGSTGYLYQNGSAAKVVGSVYKITFTVSDYVSGNVSPYISNVTPTGTPFNSNGDKTVYLRAINTSAEQGFAPPGAGSSFSIDNYVVRELAGNHATQATLAARPTYSIEPVGGRRNILEQTESLSNAYWTKTSITLTSGIADPVGGTGAWTLAATAANATVSKSVGVINNIVISCYIKRRTGSGAVALWNGTGYSTISVTGEWARVQVSQAALTAGYFDIRLSVSGDAVDLAFPQVETGSTATAYQRVTTQHDVTEAGVASVGYLYFDGASDNMVTSTITPGTDKVQMFAGVRKLRDSPNGMLLELSSTFANSGTFALQAPWDNGPSYRFVSNGNGGIGIALPADPFNAPITNVLTGLGDISGDRATLRVNGTQAAQSTDNQGTGNYLAYPLYIGARAGTSLPANVNLYSLITRFGPTLDAPTITSTETWVAGKTGFYTPIITGVPTIGVS